MPACEPASLRCSGRHPLTFARSVPYALAGDARRRRLVLDLDLHELTRRLDRARRRHLMYSHAEPVVLVEEEPAPMVSALRKLNPAHAVAHQRVATAQHAPVVQRARASMSPSLARAWSMSCRMCCAPSCAWRDAKRRTREHDSVRLCRCAVREISTLQKLGHRTVTRASKEPWVTHVISGQRFDPRSTCLTQLTRPCAGVG